MLLSTMIKTHVYVVDFLQSFYSNASDFKSYGVDIVFIPRNELWVN